MRSDSVVYVNGKQKKTDRQRRHNPIGQIKNPGVLREIFYRTSGDSEMYGVGIEGGSPSAGFIEHDSEKFRVVVCQCMKQAATEQSANDFNRSIGKAGKVW